MSGGDRKQPVLSEAVARPDDGTKDDDPFAPSATPRTDSVGVRSAKAGSDQRERTSSGTTGATRAPSAVVRASPPSRDIDADINSSETALIESKTVDTKRDTAVSFFVRGQPETQGSLRAMRGRIIAANDKELARWRGFVWTTARAAWLGRPTLTDAAIGIDLTFYVVSNRRRLPWMFDSETGLYRLATKGTKDVDKLIRAVFDGITESKLWADDGLVAEVSARAYFASPPDTPPGVLVKLREL